MKKNNKLKIFFTVSIIEILVVAVFFSYIFYGLMSKSKELHKKTVILQQKTALATIANDLENQKLQVEKEITAEKGKFFNDESLMSFLKNLSDIAHTYGLSLDDISFGGLKQEAGTNPPVMLLPISVSFSGNSYDGFVKFLSYLEKQGYPIKANSVSILTRSDSSKNHKPKGNVSASFVIYVETQSKEKWSYIGT